jgi:hypothetical protein
VVNPPAPENKSIICCFMVEYYRIRSLLSTKYNSDNSDDRQFHNSRRGRKLKSQYSIIAICDRPWLIYLFSCKDFQAFSRRFWISPSINLSGLPANSCRNFLPAILRCMPMICCNNFPKSSAIAERLLINPSSGMTAVDRLR